MSNGKDDFNHDLTQILLYLIIFMLLLSSVASSERHKDEVWKNANMFYIMENKIDNLNKKLDKAYLQCRYEDIDNK